MAVDRAGESFEPWYRAQHPHLLSALLLVTGDAEVAREAVDEAFARALERWGGGLEFPTTWTYHVALNVAHRIWRRTVLERRLLSRRASPCDVPAPAGELWQIVSTLPLRQRQVVVLRYVADLTEQDIAGVLGISRGNVARTLSDAQRRLGTLLAGDYENDHEEVPDVTP